MGIRNVLASLAKTMAIEKCQDIEALITWRLIPLDKSPRVRPITIGEVFKRIIGKYIMVVSREDVKLAAGNLQVCVDHQTGDEATIHAMKEIFKDKDVDAAYWWTPQIPFTSFIKEASCTILQSKAQK